MHCLLCTNNTGCPVEIQSKAVHAFFTIFHLVCNYSAYLVAFGEQAA